MRWYMLVLSVGSAAWKRARRACQLPQTGRNVATRRRWEHPSGVLASQHRGQPLVLVDCLQDEVRQTLCIWREWMQPSAELWHVMLAEGVIAVLKRYAQGGWHARRRARTSRHAHASGGPCCGADRRRDASCSLSCAAMTSASAWAPAPPRLPRRLPLSSASVSTESGASCSPARPSFAAQPMTSCSVAHHGYGTSSMLIVPVHGRCQVRHICGGTHLMEALHVLHQRPHHLRGQPLAQALRPHLRQAK